MYLHLYIKKQIQFEEKARNMFSQPLTSFACDIDDAFCKKRFHFSITIQYRKMIPYDSL